MVPLLFWSASIRIADPNIVFSSSKNSKLMWVIFAFKMSFRIYHFKIDLKQTHNDTILGSRLLEWRLFHSCFHILFLSPCTSVNFRFISLRKRKALSKGGMIALKMKQDWKEFQSISASGLLRLWTNKIK